jgi:hypothetical protein
VAERDGEAQEQLLKCITRNSPGWATAAAADDEGCHREAADCWRAGNMMLPTTGDTMLLAYGVRRAATNACLTNAGGVSTHDADAALDSWRTDVFLSECLRTRAMPQPALAANTQC